MLKAISLTAAIQKTTKLLTGGGVKVTQQGVHPRVVRNEDGTVASVNIPVIPSVPSADFLAALQGFVDQEVAGVLYTDPVMMNRETRKAKSDLQPRMFPAFETLLEAIERVRVEKLMAVEFQGSVRNVAKALDFVMSKGGREAIERAIADDNKKAIVSALIPLWLRSAAGNAYVSLFINEVGLDTFALAMTASFPTIAERFETLNNSAASVVLARDITLAWTTEEEAEPDSSDEGDDDDGGEAEEADEGDEGDGAAGTEADDEADGEADDDESDAEDEDALGGGGKKRKAMAEALAKISQEHRNLLSDHKNKKLSYSEIAKKRGLSEQEVQNEIREANKSLIHHYRAGRA